MSDEKDHFNEPEERPLDQLADAPAAETVKHIRDKAREEAGRRG